MLGAEITIGEETLVGCAFANSAIENIKLPSTLKKIEIGMFVGCKKLKSIELPTSIEYIGVGCFAKCGIEEIVFPSSVKEIGAGAFGYCK